MFIEVNSAKAKEKFLISIKRSFNFIQTIKRVFFTFWAIWLAAQYHDSF